MRNLLKITFLACLLCSSSLINAQNDSIFVDSIYRSYRLHVPPSYSAGTPTSLVIALHGFLGWGAQLENQSKLSLKSNTDGFIVVYPDGKGTKLASTSWNAGYCCSYAANNNSDDVGFIRQLIDSLSLQYNIDPNKVYATGMSNGGLMCYRLACELSDKIAAIAPVAATYMLDVACNPSRNLPVIHFHSYLDADIPVLGGNGSTPPYYYFPPADSMLNVFANASSCSVIQETVYSGTDYDWFRWSNCDCANEYNLFITHDGGHSWPGGNSTFIGDSASQVINANDLMWTFFMQHPLCNNTGLQETEFTEAMQVYPNPASNEIRIHLNRADKGEIRLLSLNGKLQLQQNMNGVDKVLETSSLSPGIYILEVITDSGKYINRVVLK